MNTIDKLNKKSWHFEFAQRGSYTNHTHSEWFENESGGGEWKTQIDICSYTKSVLLGLFVTLVLYVIGGGILFCAIDLVMALCFLQTPNEPGIIFLGMLVVAAIVTVAIVIHNRLQLRKNRNHDSFISLAYRSWKNKFCFKLEV